MKRHTQTILYHLLPVVFWLLAIGGIIVPLLPFVPVEVSLFHYLIPVLPVLISLWIITRLKRRTSSVEECFVVAILLGVASYWLPAMVFLAIPACIYLYSRNILEARGVMAMFIGFALVAVWMAVFTYLSLASYTFSFTKNALGWIPIGAVLFAWTASTIARQTLRVR